MRWDGECGGEGWIDNWDNLERDTYCMHILRICWPYAYSYI